jgi:hypothetical protein
MEGKYKTVVQVQVVFAMEENIVITQPWTWSLRLH